MNASLIRQGVGEVRPGGTTMAAVSLPDLVAFVVSTAIVAFLWLH